MLLRKMNLILKRRTSILRGQYRHRLAISTRLELKPKAHHHHHHHLVPTGACAQPPCVPSQSQPIPLLLCDIIPSSEPSIDLSAKGYLQPKAELKSSLEPDLPSLIPKAHSLASQSAKSTLQNSQVQDPVHMISACSQADNSSCPLKTPTVAQLKPQAPIEYSSSSIITLITSYDEDRDRNANNDKGKRKASIESVPSSKEVISMENLHLRKRPRLERAATVAHKNEQFWILDGKTVLEVGGVLFKLHRSRLVDQSIFFARLYDVHTDGVVVKSDENGIVYHLSNTTPKDLEALLQLDKNPMAYYLTPPPFPVLAAIIRAATALHFDTYRAFAVKHLENAWSSLVTDLTTEKNLMQ
ncbi:hypothetical protein BDR07DRAFT_11548 [Suillus spraguei]|nr:hypothetical protein BDR07DRAFT_11548 [Suillus spraguei]